MRMSHIVRFLIATMVFGVLLCFTNSTPATAQDGVPTLVPPTPIPRTPDASGEMLPTDSAVGRIQETGKVRVGILFNASPFAQLDISGKLVGFDADLARLLAETWGVEAEFIQVTRDLQTITPGLNEGSLDMVIGAQINHRANAPIVEYSQTYYLGQKSALVRTEDTAPASLADLNQRQVGVVVATPAEQAVYDWAQRTGTVIGAQTFLTLDEAYSALLAGGVDAVVDSEVRLNQVSQLYPGSTHILDEMIEAEPYAIVVLRQDLSMRQLINRTIQYLTITGQIQTLYQTHFSGEAFRSVDIWENVGEAPNPADYSANIAIPDSFVIGRFFSSSVVRVAGLQGVTADSDASESQRRLDEFHRQLVTEMASRWGVSVEFIPNSVTNAIELVQSGEADMAIGVSPNWDYADQVDFSSHYLRHGPRLMIRAQDVGSIRGFGDLSGADVITPLTEPDTVSYARAIAEGGNWRLDFVQLPESDLAFALLGGNEDVDADAVFADSLKLVPLVQENAGQVVLTRTDTDSPRWYGPTQREDLDFSYQMMSIALPRNDVDFRLLVEMTLQEMAQDGKLEELLGLVMLAEDIPQFEIWPGSGTYQGFVLNR